MPRRLPAPYLHRRRWTTADARAALAALESSGLSTKQFAEQEGLALNRLYRWKRRLVDGPRGSGAAPTPPLLEIRTCHAKPVEVPRLERGRFRPVFSSDGNLIRAAAQALEHSMCARSHSGNRSG